MTPLPDHPQRYAVVNEMHARPFPAFEAPGHAIYLAIKRAANAVGRNRAEDRAHLLALLDRHGAPHPPPDASHYSGQLGKFELKWESHSEFVAYSAFVPGPTARAFDPADAEVFPADWLAGAPGQMFVSLQIRAEVMPDSEDAIFSRAADWFVPDSLAISAVVDRVAVIAGDFRIDAAGHMRFAAFFAAGTGRRRIGRIIQRLCEIETYRAMSMLGFVRVRKLAQEMNVLDAQLAALVSGLEATDRAAEPTLHELLAISGALETLAVQYSFRFGATAAYEAIVNQRIEALREERLGGRQTFGELMMRSYDPAMRTVKSAETRLRGLADRAQRAADMLRTRVDVERAAQNQKVLESMDRRADLQLRLQRTVEGLSIVAISYYAVNLATYLIHPLVEPMAVEKATVSAALVLPVIAAVWLMLRRVQKKMR